MKKLLVFVMLAMTMLLMVSCSKTDLGNFEIYYDGELVSRATKIYYEGNLVCVENTIVNNQYYCWDKDEVYVMNVSESD